MGWVIVKQPNGLLARFTTIVDDFTDMDMTESEAIDMMIREHSQSPERAKQHLKAGLEDWKPNTTQRGSGLDRWIYSINCVSRIHGVDTAIERLLVGYSLDRNADDEE